MMQNLSPAIPWVGSTVTGAGTSGVMTADIVPAWIDVSRLDEISFEMSWPSTGTPIGVFKFRGSNAPAQPADETEGVALDDSDGISGWTDPAGTADDNIITVDLKEVRVKWLLFWYNRTSGGTGATLTVNILGRGR